MITFRYFFIAGLLLFLKPIYAQQNTIEYTQSADTCVPASVDDYNRLVKYFIKEKADVKQLYKFDLLQFALFRPNIAYETRIKNNLNAEFFFLYDYDGVGGSNSPFNVQMHLIALTTDLKYYYNTNNRIKKGKNTNGFSANYFSFGMGAYLFSYNSSYYNKNLDGKLLEYYYQYKDINAHLPYNIPKNQDNKIVWRTKKYEPNESIAFVRIGYGIQRRIGNIGYVAADFNFGFGTNSNFSRLYLMHEFSIKAGLAFSSFNKK